MARPSHLGLRTEPIKTSSHLSTKQPIGGMKSSGKEGSSIHTDSLSVGLEEREERKEGERRGVRASVPAVSTGTG